MYYKKLAINKTSYERKKSFKRKFSKKFYKRNDARLFIFM